MGYKHLLCKLGLHKWSRATFTDYGPTSNVRNYKKRCSRCREMKTWVEAK